MIRIFEIAEGLFLVSVTGDTYTELKAVADHTKSSQGCVVKSVLIVAIGELVKDVLVERSQDGLDGKNEGMGRG